MSGFAYAVVPFDHVKKDVLALPGQHQISCCRSHYRRQQDTQLDVLRFCHPRTVAEEPTNSLVDILDATSEKKACQLIASSKSPKAEPPRL